MVNLKLLTLFGETRVAYKEGEKGLEPETFLVDYDTKLTDSGLRASVLEGGEIAPRVECCRYR